MRSETGTKPSKSWSLAGLAIGALCVYLVARKIDWSAAFDTWKTVRPGWLLLAGLALTGMFAFSGLRWRAVVSAVVRLTPGEAFDAVMVGTLVGLFTPSRAGDLARAVLVSRRHSVAVGRILGAILLERLADVVMLVALAGVLSWTVAFPAAITAGVGALSAAGVVALAVMFLAPERWIVSAALVVRPILPSLEQRLHGFVGGMVAAIRSPGSRRALPSTVLWAIGSWTCAGLANVCVGYALAIPAPWYAGYFVLLVVNLGGVIPTSPGSIGVYHFLAMTALAVWVGDSNLTFGFAVMAHATGMMVTTLLGVTSLWRLHESLWNVERAVGSAFQSTGQEPASASHKGMTHES